MRKICLFLLVIANLTLKAQTIKIAAAANLRYVLDEIKASFEKQNPQTHILNVAGSSGALYQQIINGAGYDVFMAADRVFPDKLKAQGFVDGEVKTYAYGKLVLWSNTLDLKSKSLNILLDNGIKRIAIANPDLAPYGERAIQCLRYYHLYDKVKDKLVFADNISQTAQFAQTGNAQVGFLALSLAMAPEMGGNYILPDAAGYKPVEQSMVLIKGGQHNATATKFMEFVLSPACRPIFEKYGYLFP
ncbi:MAG: molybdate ABC transporter substrate-binding protein [Sphingobacteriales bacterium]